MSGTTHDQPSRGLEEARGVVGVQEILGVEVAYPGKRRRIDGGAGRIGWLAFATVNAVRVGGERRYRGGAVERQCQRQRVFLVFLAAPAAALTLLR